MSLTTIDSTLLDTITGGATMRQQITGRLDTTLKDEGFPMGVTVHSGPGTDGTVLAHGSFKTWLGPGGGFEHDAYSAVFKNGALEQLHTRVTGGD
jgi:hypothetical protein